MNDLFDAIVNFLIFCLIGFLIVNWWERRNKKRIKDSSEDSANNPIGNGTLTLERAQTLRSQYGALSGLQKRSLVSLGLILLFMILKWADSSLEFYAMLIVGTFATYGVWRLQKWGKFASVIFSFYLITKCPIILFLPVLGIWNIVSLKKALPLFLDTRYTRSEVENLCNKMLSQNKG